MILNITFIIAFMRTNIKVYFKLFYYFKLQFSNLHFFNKRLAKVVLPLM